MQREEQLLPFQTASLVGAKVLVLAPHPDDETIGCGGALALHRAHGDPVKVLVLTDGALAEGPDAGGPDYIALREQEARAALAILGIEEVEFWRLADRALAADATTVARLVAALEAYRPTLLYVPSPLEPHPDHAAAAQLVWSAIRQTTIPVSLCLYEVGLPIRPNTLLDITPVLSQKERALTCYASQLTLNDYKAKILGLNRYRSYTLPAHVTHAEAFWRLTSEEARTTSLNLIRWQMAGTAETAAPPDLSLVSIIVRTFNRPRFLRECLESILAQTYRNLEIVVVNDGGQDVEPILSEFRPFMRIPSVVHERPAGRPKALNAGLRQARGEFIAYLDDDDVYYPDHVATLVNFLRDGPYHVAYTDIRWTSQRIDPERGTYVTYETHQEFSKEFDPDWLLFENYIPINAVMHTRKVLDVVGLFDEGVEVLEGWELWIRMSRSYRFGHIAKCTAEYRIRNDASHVALKAERDSLLRTHEIKLFEKYAAERLEAVQRLFSSLKQAVFHVESELQRVKSETQGLLAQREGEPSKRDEVIRSLEARLQAEVDTRRRLEQSVERVTESLGWRLLQRFYNLRGRTITPQGSIREKVYEWIKSQVGPTMRRGT